MTPDFLQWARANRSRALVANALLEPRYPNEGIGAAFVIRACLYFEKAFDAVVREALAQTFDEFVVSMGDEKLTYMWHNGKAARPMSKVKSLQAVASGLGPEDRFDFDFMSGERPEDAGLWEFHVGGIRRWQEKLDNRGFNALSFSWPVFAVQERPNSFARLFFDAASRLKAAHGHAGVAVNLSPTGREENEATEYWASQRMPGLDVGFPGDLSVRQLKGQLKTVDWLTAISKPMLDAVGGLVGLRSHLPPGWFSIGDYGHGVVIRAGALPESGISSDEKKPPVNPPAYVILDAALRSIRATEMDILQRGTVNGDAPVYNTRSSTAAWLRRFETDENGLLATKAALLDTPPLQPSNVLPNPL
ncbi:DUF3396 domain-containing protein [Paraburkholderia sp. D15]|uniref:type VI immunity family protein n=1 Tax=Paraburkholderia sp. D15 TaxID=2880218 RepID=UPI00247AAF5B|nr:type VI immunity family protein [Paraburkholderia sp. D15]WGS51864.1 DUF3396 domain-containing protein [Paraburkholderia sp. D15]